MTLYELLPGLRTEVKDAGTRDIVRNDDLPPPYWVSSMTRKMCNEGADLFLAWHAASAPIARYKVEDEIHRQEIRVDARALLLQHNAGCAVCLQARMSVFPRLLSYVMRVMGRNTIFGYPKDAAYWRSRSSE